MEIRGLWGWQSRQERIVGITQRTAEDNSYGTEHSSRWWECHIEQQRQDGEDGTADNRE